MFKFIPAWLSLLVIACQASVEEPSAPPSEQKAVTQPARVAEIRVSDPARLQMSEKESLALLYGVRLLPEECTPDGMLKLYGDAESPTHVSYRYSCDHPDFEPKEFSSRIPPLPNTAHVTFLTPFPGVYLAIFKGKPMLFWKDRGKAKSADLEKMFDGYSFELTADRYSFFDRGLQDPALPNL
jgi:hypothetical protein